MYRSAPAILGPKLTLQRLLWFRGTEKRQTEAPASLDRKSPVFDSTEPTKCWRQFPRKLQLGLLPKTAFLPQRLLSRRPGLPRLPEGGRQGLLPPPCKRGPLNLNLD